MTSSSSEVESEIGAFQWKQLSTQPAVPQNEVQHLFQHLTNAADPLTAGTTTKVEQKPVASGPRVNNKKKKKKNKNKQKSESTNTGPKLNTNDLLQTIHKEFETAQPRTEEEKQFLEQQKEMMKKTQKLLSSMTTAQSKQMSKMLPPEMLNLLGSFSKK